MDRINRMDGWMDRMNKMDKMDKTDKTDKMDRMDGWIMGGGWRTYF